jgi:predicted transcriptional regulator
LSDHIVGREDVERALQDYAAGRFTTPDETLRVKWTTPEEPSRLRHEAFGGDD